MPPFLSRAPNIEGYSFRAALSKPIQDAVFVVIAWAALCAWGSGLVAEQGVEFVLARDHAPLEVSDVPLLHEPVPEALAGQGLSIEPLDDPYGWWREAEDARPFPLRISACEESFDRAVLTAWDPHNHAVARWGIEPGRPLALSLSLRDLGAYLLTLDGFLADEPRRRFVRALARTQDLREARERWRDDEFFLGVCAFPGRYHWRVEGAPTLPSGLDETEARSREADLLARAGFSVVRLDVSMEMGLAPEEDGGGYLYDFARMDEAVETYVSRGFRLALQLMNAGDWAISERYADRPEPRWPLPRDLGHQRAYTRALVGRYARHARFVQIHNEPDQLEFWAGEPEEFVAQHRAMLEEIQSLAPGLPVANGGYAFIEEERTPYFVRELKGLADYQAYHAHGPLEGLKRNFERMRALHAEAGYEAPVYLNSETGFDAWRLDQERRQGQAVAQRVLYCWANDHRGVLVFCGRMTRGPGREGRDLGLLDYEFGPRFAYAAVAALVSALAGTSHEATLLEETEGTHLYRFRRGDEWVLAGFTLDDAGAELVIDPGGAVEVESVDEMGNRSPVSEGGASLTLRLDGYPRYWVFRGLNSELPPGLEDRE